MAQSIKLISAEPIIIKKFQWKFLQFKLNRYPATVIWHNNIAECITYKSKHTYSHSHYSAQPTDSNTYTIKIIIIAIILSHTKKFSCLVRCTTDKSCPILGYKKQLCTSRIKHKEMVCSLALKFKLKLIHFIA